MTRAFRDTGRGRRSPSGGSLGARRSVFHLEAGQLFLDGTQNSWVRFLLGLLGTVVLC